MPTPTKGPRLGSGPAHQRLLLAGLATQLFEHRSITTTEAKAKRLRPYAERLVTFAKKGDLASRRQVMKVVRDKSVVHELFTEIGPAVANRPGGYTRITKIGNRKGDNAPLAVIELVLDPVSSTTREAEAATARAARGNRSSADAPTAGTAPATGTGAAEGAAAEPTTTAQPTTTEDAPGAEATGAASTTAVAADADGELITVAPQADAPAAESVVTGEVVEPDVEAPGATGAAGAGDAAGTAADPAPVADAGDATVAPDEAGDGGTEGAGDQRA